MRFEVKVGLGLHTNVFIVKDRKRGVIAPTYFGNPNVVVSKETNGNDLPANVLFCYFPQTRRTCRCNINEEVLKRHLHNINY